MTNTIINLKAAVSASILTINKTKISNATELNIIIGRKKNAN